MTDRERLKNQITALERELINESRGKVIITGKAIKLREKKEQLMRELDELDRKEVDLLNFQRIPFEELLDIIALPLIADVITEIVAGVDSMLRRNGCEKTVFSHYTSQIRSAALAIVDTLNRPDLPRLLDHDDTLVDAVYKKVKSFIRQRINITNE